MISIQNILTIFKKEFLQMMRDKSVLFTNFFIPLFGLPLYLLIVFESISYLAIKDHLPPSPSAIFTISYQGHIPPALQVMLEQDKRIHLTPPASFIDQHVVDDYRKEFKTYLETTKESGSIQQKLIKAQNSLWLALKQQQQQQHRYKRLQTQIQDKFDFTKINLHIAFYKSDEQVLATYFFYSQENKQSLSAKQYVESLIKKYEKQTVEHFKEKQKIKTHQLTPFHFWNVELTRSIIDILQSVGIMIGGWLLFMLLIASYNPVINTTLGERDNQTYKILLMNPVTMNEIFAGKYLNIALQALLTLVPYLLEAFVFYLWGNSNYLFSSLPLLTPINLTLFLLSTISAAICISAFCFLASSFSKSRNQAQSLMTLLIFAIMIPLFAVGAAKVKLGPLSSLLPIINYPLVIENLMIEQIDLSAILLACLVNIVFSIAIIWFSLNAFEIQWKGKSDSKGLSDLLSFKRRHSKQLGPAHAFLAFCLAYLGYAYGGFALKLLQIELFQHFLAPLLFGLGTTVFIIYNSKMDFTHIFKWNNPAKAHNLLSCLLGAALAILFYSLNKYLLNANPFALPKLFAENSGPYLLGYLLIFALFPAITEELLFRGIIFQGLRNQYHFALAAILSALFFSLIQFSLSRFIYIFIIGLILAYLHEKRGLTSCIIFRLFFSSALILTNLLN